MGGSLLENLEKNLEKGLTENANKLVVTASTQNNSGSGITGETLNETNARVQSAGSQPQPLPSRHSDTDFTKKTRTTLDILNDEDKLWSRSKDFFRSQTTTSDTNVENEQVNKNDVKKSEEYEKEKKDHEKTKEENKEYKQKIKEDEKKSEEKKTNESFWKEVNKLSTALTLGGYATGVAVGGYEFTKIAAERSETLPTSKTLADEEQGKLVEESPYENIVD